jgi:hypothetical protein
MGTWEPDQAGSHGSGSHKFNNRRLSKEVLIAWLSNMFFKKNFLKFFSSLIFISQSLQKLGHLQINSLSSIGCYVQNAKTKFYTIFS